MPTVINVVLPNVLMPNVLMPNVLMPNVVAPFETREERNAKTINLTSNNAINKF